MYRANLLRNQEIVQRAKSVDFGSVKNDFPEGE